MQVLWHIFSIEQTAEEILSMLLKKNILQIIKSLDPT